MSQYVGHDVYNNKIIKDYLHIIKWYTAIILFDFIIRKDKILYEEDWFYRKYAF